MIYNNDIAVRLNRVMFDFYVVADLKFNEDIIFRCKRENKLAT